MTAKLYIVKKEVRRSASEIIALVLYLTGRITTFGSQVPNSTEEEMNAYGFPKGLKKIVMRKLKMEASAEYQLPANLKIEKDKQGKDMVQLNDQMLNELFSTQGNINSTGFHKQYWTMHTVPGDRGSGWGLREGRERIVLKSGHGKWLCAEHDNLVANRDAAGPWEKFTPIP